VPWTTVPKALAQCRNLLEKGEAKSNQIRKFFEYLTFL